MDALVDVSPLVSSGIDLEGRKSALVALLKSVSSDWMLDKVQRCMSCKMKSKKLQDR